ncbi:transposase, MuDR, MULE transposase domain protein [Tanacetum coccineum]
MASNIKKFKCLIHFNETQRGSILSEDLTYSMLHEMVMQKFKLEANAVINLSFKLSSFDFAVDITDDAEVQFFVGCACNSNDEFAHLFVSEQKNMFFNFFESTTLENEGPSNQEIPSSHLNNSYNNTSFLNNGISFYLGQNDFHINDSLHLQNEPHFSNPESSFDFRSNEYNTDDVVNENPQNKIYKWQKFMSFEPDIPETPIYKAKPNISKQYSQQSEVEKGKIFDNKESLILAVRLKALSEGFQFLTDRSDPERCYLECYHFTECDWSRVLRGKDIQQDILSEYKIHISYQQAMKGKHYDDNGVFEMLFIAIGASIRTFLNYLRPMLMIDVAHLKGLYKGTNLVAVAMDGNNQIVPIAFGICKGETGPCWSWWMSVLKECIGDNPNLLFISDRHAAIALAVEKEFPLAFHAVCCRHLMMNLGLKNKKRKGLFWKICKAYTREDYATNMNTLQIVQPDAHEKLCRAGPQRWSRAHCPLVRYNYMTSNSVESVNACSVIYRKEPVLKLAETYRAMVQECKYDVRNNRLGSKQSGKKKMKSATWVVKGVNAYQYEVSDGQYIREVNLQTGICGCRKWQLSGLPCGHVIAITRFLGLTDCVHYVADWFKKPKYQGTYSESIHSLGNMQQWEFPENIQKAIPPRMDNPQPGRPKNTNRIQSQGEEPRIIRCTRCTQTGHIRDQCGQPFVVQPPVNIHLAKVCWKLQIFVAHTPIDLSTVLIPNDGSFEQSLAGVISEATKIKLEESLKYLHQMQKRKNKKFDYYGLWGELGTNIHALYYKIPHNGFSVTVKLRNNYDMHVMFDICSAQYKLEIYIDHIGVNFVIHKYIFPNASLAEMMNHVITDYSSENEGIIRQETQNDYNSDQMVEWAEQEHFEYEETKVSCPKIDLSSMLIHNNRSKEESFGESLDEEAILEEQMLALMHRFADRFTDRRIEINNLMVLQDHPLIDYVAKEHGRKTTADDELQRHVKALLLNTNLLTSFIDKERDAVMNIVFVTPTPMLQQDSPAEEAETESNVWDDGSEDVNPFGGGNPGFHDGHYDNPLLTKETESKPIFWDIGDEEEEYSFVNKYLSFQEEPIVSVEDESCPIYDTDNEEEENRCRFMIPILKMSLRRKKDLLGKKESVGKKTT